MQRFLRFVVEETLAGRAEQLCEYVIGVAVFDQPDSFEPATNPIVRNDARRLRQKLHEYYRHSRSEADQFVINIPKGGYIPVFSPIVRSTRSGAERPSRLRIRITGFGKDNETWTKEYECETCEILQISIWETAAVAAQECTTRELSLSSRPEDGSAVVVRAALPRCDF
jgi:hypothetical protein